MGTRHLTCVVHSNQQFKVAQYGQWDGYPSGQGRTILEFLKVYFNREKFLANLAKCRYVTNETIAYQYRKLGADDTGFVSMDIADAFKERWPSLDRDMGADILQAIQDSPDGLDLYLQTEFAGDSLFCEWAYVIDLDNNVLEVYKGFNKEPLTPIDRFYQFTRDDSEYHPVKLFHTFTFDALPNYDDFIAILEKEDDEEDA